MWKAGQAMRQYWHPDGTLPLLRMPRGAGTAAWRGQKRRLPPRRRRHGWRTPCRSYDLCVTCGHKQPLRRQTGLTAVPPAPAAACCLPWHSYVDAANQLGNTTYNSDTPATPPPHARAVAAGHPDVCTLPLPALQLLAGATAGACRAGGRWRGAVFCSWLRRRGGGAGVSCLWSRWRRALETTSCPGTQWRRQ